MAGSLAFAVAFDWDGDGRADLPVAGRDQPGHAGEIFLHLGGRDEVVRLPIPAPARGIYDLGDFDGDGRSSLGVDWGDQDLAIYDARSLATQDPQRPQPAGWLTQSNRAVAVGDVDGDGDDDFVSAAAVCLGDLPEPCAQALIMGARSDTVLPLGDVDGDGKADLCVDDLLIFGGTDGERARQGQLPWQPVDAFDWDGDGDLDLLRVERAREACAGARLSVLERRGGAFVEGPSFELTTAEDRAACRAGGARLFVANDGTAADLDRDGHADLLFAQDASLRVWYGPKGARRETIGPAWGNLLPRRVGDLDGDGFADLLLTTSGEHFVHALSVLDATGRRPIPPPAWYDPDEDDVWGAVSFRVYP